MNLDGKSEIPGSAEPGETTVAAATASRRARAWRGPGWHGPPVVLVAGWLLLALAWVFANPPFAAPDERDHYVRAIGIAQGQLVGDPAPEARIGENAAEIKFTKQTQRAISVPARLDPMPFDCYVINPRASAGCLNRPPRTGPPARVVTAVGTYPPLGLLAPAAVVSRADNPFDADRLGRLAGMLVALALLIAAAATLFQRDSGWLSLAGLLASSTPTAIFLSASVTPSGLSVCAGLALTATLLRIGRAGHAPRAVWTLLGISGAALALSHPLGLAWAAILVGGFVAWKRIGVSGELVGQQRRVAWPGLSLLATGALASFAWHLAIGASAPIDVRAVRRALALAPGEYWDGLRQVVGGFGYLEFRLPLFVYLLWFALVAGLVIAALSTGCHRDRLALIGAGALAVAIPVGLWILFGRAVGIGLNGREFMPLLVALPMLAGEIVNRNRARVSRALKVTLTVLVAQAGVLQFVAWYLNGRRSAVGTTGPLLFPSHAQWVPPLGWGPWLAIAGCGAVLLAATSLAGSSAGTSQAPAADLASRRRADLTGPVAV